MRNSPPTKNIQPRVLLSQNLTLMKGKRQLIINTQCYEKCVIVHFLGTLEPVEPKLPCQCNCCAGNDVQPK